MAQRRMFSKAVIHSARFLRMPQTSRLLYYDLGMSADDEGVVEAFTVLRTTGAAEDDLRVLASKGFVVVLNEELVTYITDWSINNQVRMDRFSPSIYGKLLVQVCDGNQVVTNGLPSGNQVATQCSIDEEREVKDRKGKELAKPLRTRFVPPSLTDVAAYCRSRNSPVDPVKFFEYFEAGDWRDAKGQPVKNWKQKLLTWENQEKQRVSQHPETHAADLSWRDARSFASEDLIEEPPGSGQYRLREKVSANA